MKIGVVLECGSPDADAECSWFSGAVSRPPYHHCLQSPVTSCNAARQTGMFIVLAGEGKRFYGRGGNALRRLTSDCYLL